MGSDASFYLRAAPRLSPLKECECPILSATAPAPGAWPWQCRNRKELKELVSSLGDETHEWVLALYLDVACNLLAVETLAQGDAWAVQVPISRLMCRGRALGANAFILAHNHPSGIARPSRGDIAVTRRIREVGEAMDLHMLDHVIVAGNEMVSVDPWH